VYLDPYSVIVMDDTAPPAMTAVPAAVVPSVDVEPGYGGSENTTFVGLTPYRAPPEVTVTFSTLPTV
jgi:hypothetical protein